MTSKNLKELRADFKSLKVEFFSIEGKLAEAKVLRARRSEVREQLRIIKSELASLKENTEEINEVPI
jgi:uncharacterized coiled-coil DUF342 family protein